MSTAAGNKKKSGTRPPPDPTKVPAPVTTIDRIVLEIRKLIAASIFFNAQNAGKIGLGLTDMQMIHLLQLYGASTPSKLGKWTGLSSGGVTVALDRLEQAGYIRRGLNANDRRSLFITVVPARMRKIAALYEGIEKETRRLLGTLPPGDLQGALHVFEALHSARPDSSARKRR